MPIAIVHALGRIALALWFLVIALSKLWQGPAPGTLLASGWLWLGVSMAEVLMALLLVVPSLWRAGCMIALAFAATAVGTTAIQTPCGCGGAWFNVTNKTRIASALLVGSAACWLLSWRPLSAIQRQDVQQGPTRVYGDTRVRAHG